MARIIALAAVATLIVGAVTANAAEKASPLAPLAFLAGHCWTSPFPDGKSTDTHCFEWVHGGQQLRDQHVVRGSDGKAQYQGETLYLWDAGSSRIIYRYVDATGGHSDGYVDTSESRLRFPEDRYVGPDGKGFWFVTEWRRVDPSTYEAKTQQKVGDSLKDVFSFRFVRNDK